MTICAQERACLFGDVRDGDLRLTDAGRMVEAEWERIGERFPDVDLDAFVVMPNHVHGIVVIEQSRHRGVGRGRSCACPPDVAALSAATGTNTTLGDIVGTFKSRTTHAHVMGVRQSDWPAFERRLWQRNYYEHIIRTDEDLARIRAYIESNPARWSDDPEHPALAALRPRQGPVQGMGQARRTGQAQDLPLRERQ